MIEKPSENWTKFPNCILDHLDQFTPIEFKILGLMVRKNLGFENPNYEFSIRYISEELASDKNTVSKGLKGLINKGSIFVVGQKNRGTRLFKINWIEPNFKPAAQQPADPPQPPAAVTHPEPVLSKEPEPPPPPDSVFTYSDMVDEIISKIPCKVPDKERKWLLGLLEKDGMPLDFIHDAVAYTTKKISEKGRKNHKPYFEYLKKRLSEENLKKYLGTDSEVQEPPKVIHPPLFVPPPEPSEKEKEKKQMFFKITRWFIDLPADRKEEIVPGSSTKERLDLYNVVNKNTERIMLAYETER